MGGRVLFAGLTLGHLTDFLFVIIAAIVFFKFFFSQDGEFLVSTVDFLVLGTSLFLSVIIAHYGVALALTGILLKGILLYLGVKVVTTYGSRMASSALVYSMMVTLLVVSLRGFLGI